MRVHGTEHTEVCRNPHFCPAGPEGIIPLKKERQRFFPSTLQEHPRPYVKGPQSVPELKPLFLPDCHLFLGRCLHLGSEPAVTVYFAPARRGRGVADLLRLPAIAGAHPRTSSGQGTLGADRRAAERRRIPVAQRRSAFHGRPDSADRLPVSSTAPSITVIGRCPASGPP